MIGNRFGRWKVKSYEGGARHRWLCICDCGTEKSVREDNLINGISQSCGCLQRELASLQAKERLTTHGKSKDRIYKQWCGLVKRCTNPKCEAFSVYGELNHDANWLTSFEAFFKDFGSGYFEGATIDRIDNSKGYSKENCRWVNHELQSRNKTKRKDNSSGTTGVYWREVNGATRAICVWKDDGMLKSKSFSVNKYGLLEAFALAVAYRKAQIERLNSLGYGYTETHGQ